MKNIKIVLKIVFVMVLVNFSFQYTNAQIGVTCQDASGCVLEVATYPNALLYVLTGSDDCEIIGASTDGFFPADDLAGNYCYHTVYYSDESASSLADAIATGCTDDLIALGETNDEITVNRFCNVFVVPFECADFHVDHWAICSPPDANGDRTYQVLLTMSGGNIGNNGYFVTDNKTGESFGPIAGPSITFNAADAGTGYSYTVSVTDNPTCSVAVSESIIDCTATGSN